MYWPYMPYLDLEEMTRRYAAAQVGQSRRKIYRPVKAASLVPAGNPARLLLSELWGAIRALYVSSRPDCPSCFYCGKPATRRGANPDLCEKHWDEDLRHNY